MNDERFYRDEMAFWLQVKCDAVYFEDQVTEQFAIHQYRLNRDRLLSLWALGTVA